MQAAFSPLKHSLETVLIAVIREKSIAEAIAAQVEKILPPNTVLAPSSGREGVFWGCGGGGRPVGWAIIFLLLRTEGPTREISHEYFIRKYKRTVKPV